MRLLGIAGHGNGSGKTLLIERIVRAHPGRFGVVKFTTIFRGGPVCPKDKTRRCACSRLRGEHQIITDDEILGQPDTDTGRLLAAGARPVRWVLCREGGHRAAWQEARATLPEAAELLTEGNTVLSELEPECILFVANPAVPRALWKDGWQALAARADALLVNEAPEAVDRGEPAPLDERAATVMALQDAAPDVPRIVARLEAPLEQWAGPWLEDLLAPPTASTARPA